MSGVTRKRQLSPKSIFDEHELRAFFSTHSVNNHHINSIYRHIVQNGARSFDEIPELPARILPLLKKEFVLSTSKVAERLDASDGSTTKLVVELQDGQKVETVIMRYGDVELKSFPKEERERRAKELEKEGKQFKSNRRATVCLSSQVGCAMGCTFCATGTMGLLSNLSTGEIVEQLMHANEVEKIRNVVFMGMGEPLDNYDAVLGSIQAMINTSRFGLSPARISVSTVGVVPRIQALMRDVPQIGLALSLHAPTQELRQEIVPSSKSFSLSKILAAVFAFIENQNKANSSSPRHILIEYVLIENINSSVEVAHQLGQLFAARVDRKDILVNIIPYNPTDVIAAYEKPTPETLKEFVATVRSYGVHTLIRQELGQDIASACGQLVVKNQGIGKKLGGCDDEKEAKDLEDLVGAGKSTGAKPNVVKRTRKEDVKVEDANDASSGDKPAGLSMMTIAVAAVGLGLLSLAALRSLKRK
ncbi:sorting nexin [Chytriomyces hyalinus]|nr:sorting nexin [Chytriomyces hyalinus]